MSAAPIRALALAAAIVAVACERSPKAEAGPPTPRVLFVTWDTTRADHVGAYGGAARTPRFDALAKSGVLYEQVEACAPITLPSHASLLTGVLPCAHGVRDNSLFELGAAARLLPEALHDAGFKTGAFVAAYVLDPKFGLAQGFDVYDAPDVSGQSLAWSVVERPAGAVADAAIRWIDSLREDDRFFLWVHFYDPHQPWSAPPDPARPDASPYDLEIEQCDRELGRLLDRLHARGLDRGLITAVTADHGESLGDHGEKTHGLFLYESTMRVPLVVAPPPAGVAPGSRVRTRVSNVELAVTLLERVGLARAQLPDARTLALPSGDSANPSSGDSASERAAGDERALLLESLTSFYFRRWAPLRALVWQDFKYVDAPRPELYSLADDPTEAHDLAREKPEVAARMAARLAALAKENAPLRWDAESSLSEGEKQAIGKLGYAVGDRTSAGEGGDPFAIAGLPDPKDRVGELDLRDELVAKVRDASALLGLDGSAPGGSPADAEERRVRGNALLGEAKASLAKLRETAGEDSFVLGLAPTIELGLGNWAAAADGFEKLVALHPRQASNHHNLAAAYARLGRTSWAQREMEKAAFLDPQSPLAARWLAELALSRRDFPTAAWWLDELLKHKTTSGADRTQWTTMRAQVQKQLALVNAKPRPPAPIDDAALASEGARTRGDAAAAAANGNAPAPKRALPAPKRALLVTLDTTRADRLGCYGRAAARTPFLDQLAKEGERFDHAWCAAPITLPSHATILSGVLPCAHGVRDNGLYALGEEATLVSEVLQKQGFKTGGFVASFVLDPRFGIAQGFDVYRAPAAAALGLKPEVVQRPASSVVDDAIGWLESLPKEASFFLWVHFYDPHAPHEAPAPFDRMFTDAYDGEIAACDSALARLRARMVELGLSRGLLEVVTADHGEALGEHGEATHGLLLHDATMRVPLLLRGPGIAAGAVVHEPVGNAQVAPTILASLGFETSLLPECREKPLPRHPPEGGAASGDDPAPQLLETFLPFHLHRWHPLLGLVVGNAKLVHGRFDQLFDLAADPGETRELASEQPERVAALRRRLDALIAGQPRLPAPSGPSLSEEDRARLRALGYAGDDAGGATGPDASSSLADPREAVGDAEAQQRALTLLQQARELLGQDAAMLQPGGAKPADPKSTDPKQVRGRELLEQARAILVGIAQKRPDDPSIAFDLGNVELSAGRAADAAPRFEVATLADPTNASNHYNLAIAYAGASQIDFAIAEMEKAIQCEPRLLLARRWLIGAHEQRGELGRAVWWADRVEESGALDPRELAPMRAMREQLRSRINSAARPRPPRPWPKPDLRPERIIQAPERLRRGA